MPLKNDEQTVTWKWMTLPLLFLAITLIFISCQKESITQLEAKVAPDQTAVEDARKKIKEMFRQNRTMSKLDLLEKFPEKYNALQSNARSKNSPDLIKKLSEMHVIEEHKEMMAMAINPDDFICGGQPTILDDYFLSVINDINNMTEEDRFFLFNFNIIPLFEGLFFDNDDSDESFGINDEYSSSMRKNFIDLKTFWDIPTDILLLDIKGTVFQDAQAVAQVIQFAFTNFDEAGNPIPFSAAEALELAEALKVIFAADVFDNYNHPLFSFNAVAFSGIPELGIGKKVLMGDGLMEGHRAVGLRTIAEKFILAHEYGHQIQFANDIINDELEQTPENTRRVELMADAFAAYFMAHRKGPFLQPLIITRYAKTAFAAGDCAFDSPGHHGTPNQRRKAAELGGELASPRGLRDPSYSSEEFVELFNEAFPEIIAPDAN